MKRDVMVDTDTTVVAGGVRVELLEQGSVLALTLATPKANIIDAAKIRALLDAFARIAREPQIKAVLIEGEGDLLMWIASISPDLAPPSTDIPTIVLGTPGLRLPLEPAVFIPVGTPGVDEKGRLVRCDSVVSLPGSSQTRPRRSRPCVSASRRRRSSRVRASKARRVDDSSSRVLAVANSLPSSQGLPR